jgi:hypothetical protein
MGLILSAVSGIPGALETYSLQVKVGYYVLKLYRNPKKV